MRFDVLLQIVIGVLLAIAGVVAVMLDALLLAACLWIVLAGTFALTVRSYGKQHGWNRRTIRIGGYGSLLFILLLMVPLYGYVMGEITIELSPRVIMFTKGYKVDGHVIEQREYGFGVIARIQKTGRIAQRISGLEIVGEIDADGSDYMAAFGEGLTFEQLDHDYGENKPYYRASFVSFPINLNKVETGQEFVRFMILDPTNLGTQSTTRGAEAQHYFGFHGESPHEPTLAMTVPNIHSFVKFTAFQRIDQAGNGVLQRPRLREEIKSGRLQFILKLDTGLKVINPQNIHEPVMMSLDNWNKQTPQDVFFRNNPWDRAFPAERDPIPKALND